MLTISTPMSGTGRWVYGKGLMDWLKAEAKTNGCVQLHVDSGVRREQTHRFYFREGLAINCYHFRVSL